MPVHTDFSTCGQQIGLSFLPPRLEERFVFFERCVSYKVTQEKAAAFFVVRSLRWKTCRRVMSSRNKKVVQSGSIMVCICGIWRMF
jgi:hypothetical protein